jgi:hypothetical protein
MHISTRTSIPLISTGENPLLHLTKPLEHAMGFQ